MQLKVQEHEERNPSRRSCHGAPPRDPYSSKPSTSVTGNTTPLR